MPQRLKGKVVQIVTYDVTCETAEVRVLQRPLRFCCTVHDEYFEDVDGEKVAKWADQALRRHAVVEWIPAIEIFIDRLPYARDGFTDPQYNGIAECGFEYRRLYIGKTSTGFREVPWHHFDPARPIITAAFIHNLKLKRERESYSNNDIGRFDGSLPYVDRGTDADVFDEEDEEGSSRRERRMFRALLPYSDRTWAALQGVAQTLRTARLRLIDLLGSGEGRGALVGTADGILALADPDTA